MRKVGHSRGFTLIELLAVLAIMGIMSGIGLLSYIDMTRGSAMRSAVAHLSSVIMLARQTAVMQGRRVFLYFSYDDRNKNGSRDIGEPYYYVSVIREGSGTADSATSLSDPFADLQAYTFVTEDIDENRRPVVFNMMNNRASRLRGVTKDAASEEWTIETFDPIWVRGPGDPTLIDYGWEAAPRTYLPTGFGLDDSAASHISEPLIFNPDGTTEGSPDGNYIIRIEEDSRAVQGAYASVTVSFPTGAVNAKIFGE